MNRRKFIKAGALFVPTIFVPKLIRAQSFTFKDPAFIAANNQVEAGSSFSYTAATLDGTNDSLHRNATLTSIADSKVFILSCWMNLNVAGDGTFQGVWYVDGSNRIYLAGSNVNLSFDNGGLVINAATVSGAIASGLGWFHLLAAGDTADSTKTHIYINGAADEAVGVQVNANILWSTFADVGAFGLPSGAVPVNGCISELYFDTRWQDITNATVRGYYRNSGTGKPVDVQTSNGGSWASGGQPAVYFHTYDGTNLGYGGDFAVRSGPFSSCTAP